MEFRKLPGWQKDWVLLKGLDLSAVSRGSGAYMIAADRPLNRAVGVDHEGILDIGKASNLRSRLATFWKCAIGERARGHMAGWRFGYHKMAKHFPPATLYVCWCATETVIEAASEESRLILAYINQHMESPPLNYSVPWPVG